MTGGNDDHFRRVQADHYSHRLALFSIGIWAASVWGWVAGLVTFFALVLLISISNIVIAGHSSSFRAVQFNRWAWLVFAAAFIVVKTAKVVDFSAG